MAWASLHKFCVMTVANPPAPYSIQTCPEPRICQKFVPTIVFRGSNQGDRNLSKICRKFEKRQFLDKFSNFRRVFDKSGPPPLIGTPKNNRRENFLTNLGFGAFLNAVTGRRVRKMTAKTSPPGFFYLIADPIHCTEKGRHSKCNFLMRKGLHENYVMNRRMIPPDFCMYVVFLRCGVESILLGLFACNWSFFCLSTSEDFCLQSGLQYEHLNGPVSKNASAVSVLKATGLTRESSSQLRDWENLGCTPRGSCNNTLLGRVLRRFLKAGAS